MERSFQKSVELYERALKVMPAGVSSHLRSLEKPAPISFTHAEGSKMFDVDGNTYIDYMLGLGPLILGHSPKNVLAAVHKAIDQGQIYAGQHELEVEVATMLVEQIDCAEKVRFALSGTDVTQLAVRLAKAYTGRSKILKFEGHYHGWADNVYISAWLLPQQLGDRANPKPVLMSKGQSPFLVDETIVLPWNDAGLVEDVFRKHGDDIACVMMEPTMCNSGGIWPRPGYLEAVRDLCDKYGTLLVFDEVISGFRFHPGGVQTLLGVKPDLTTLGKAVAAGFPVSALVGRNDVMDFIGRGEVMHAGTFNGNVIGMAAAKQTILDLKENDGQVYKDMNRRGERLMNGIRERAAAHGLPVLVKGKETAFHVHFTEREDIFEYRDIMDNDNQRYNQFRKELVSRGIRLIFRGNWYLSAAHTDEDIDFTLDMVDEALTAMKEQAS